MRHDPLRQLRCAAGRRIGRLPGGNAAPCPVRGKGVGWRRACAAALLLAGMLATGMLPGGRLAVAADASAHPAPSLRLGPGKALTQYVHETWTVDDGLPQNTVNALAQAPDGYLWVGTEEGLARYNGLSFSVFDHTNTPAFEGSTSVTELHVDAAGVLWIGTRDGLIRYADGRFARYDEAHGLGGAHVSALLTDAAGRLWVGTYDGGLYSFDGTGFTRFAPSVITNDLLVTSLYEDVQGVLWAGTGRGLYRLEGNAVRAYTAADGLADDFVLQVQGDAAGRLWAGTRNGLSVLEDGRLLPPAAAGEAAAQTVFAILDEAGVLWLGTDGAGLARLQGGRMETFTTADGLLHDRVMSLLVDHEGSLWIGTEGGGLSRLRDSRVTMLGTRERLGHDMAMTVYEDARGALWVGTEGGGLTRFEAGVAQTWTTAEGLPSDVVLSLQEDAYGALWVGTYGGGAARLADGRFTRFSTREGFPSDAVFALHRGHSGALWIGTDAGAARYTPQGFTFFTETDGLSSNLVSTVYEDRRGDVWVGTIERGLNRLRDGRITRYGRRDGLSSDMVTALHEDRTGSLWIGTYGGGLNRLKDGRLSSVRAADGLWSDNVYAILEDEAGHLWVSSNRGVFRAELEALHAVADGRAETVACTVFGREDGLRSPEMNGGVQPAGWKGRDGTLWFASVKGVAGFHPDRLARNLVPPPVVVESVLVDGRPVEAAAELTLRPGTKKIDFHFVALTFISPEKVVYEYRLDGYDDGWQSAEGGHAATYTNLAPGAYTFRVRARNSDGVWSEHAAAVAFRQQPFFYQTPLFWGAAVLLGLLLAWGGYRLRVRHLEAHHRRLEALVAARTRDLQAANEQIGAQAARLEELDRFKTSFFANISHEFRTPLTLMIGPLENALTGAYGRVEAPLDGQLKMMLRNALRLLRLINQLLDLSKLEASRMDLHARPRDLVPFVEGVTLSFSAFAAHKGIQLDFRSEVDAAELYFEPDKLEKVFFNLLSNAVKFTPAGGAIAVGVVPLGPSDAAPEGAVAVHVRDTGPGIPAEHLPHVFDRFRQVDDSNTRKHEGTGIGLALAKELVLLHGGTIEVQSEPGEGTEFVVTLLQGTAHLQAHEIETDRADADEMPQGHDALAEMASAEFNVMARADRGADEPAAPPAQQAPPDAPLILVVDDNADIRDYVDACLRGTYRVETAVDGADGLRKAAELRPDLIVSDIMMPNMNGFTLVERIKTDARLRHIPVILLSAKTSQDTVLQSLDHGADEYVAKPFNARELHARIRNLLKMRAQERELQGLNEHLQQKVEEQLEIIMVERIAYEEKLLAEKELAEEAARLKSAILANMSHEFRTPMTAILGYTDILRMELEGEWKEFAGYIHKNARRLMDTLSAILDLSRLESGSVQMHAVDVNVVDVVASVVSEFAPQAAEKGLDLHSSTSEPELSYRVDAAALQRVLAVLVDNAVKFTEHGSVVVEAGRIEGDVFVRVRDTGVGISPAFLPQLFNAFEQESSGDARAHEGTGLSLSIAHRLIHFIGGTIEVASEPGRGSAFTLRLAGRTPGEPIAGDGSPTRLSQVQIRSLPEA